MRNKLIEKECIEIGGHCWNYHDSNDTVDEFGNRKNNESKMVYPMQVIRYRTCKHCGRREKEIPSRWEEKRD